MTREDQTTFHTNIERCEIAEAGGAQIMLRLHCNNSSNRSKRGIQVYGPQNIDYAKAVADADTYREMGQKLLDAMKTRVGMTLANSRRRSAARRRTTSRRITRTEGVECVFLRW